ncbi:MAG: hypothetical protein RBT62_08525, partial [Spirochaetia bacterium]|nr:hypothetical protein [Spirochaetia bacterium]
MPKIRPLLQRTRHRRFIAGAGLVAVSIALYILSFLDLGLLASIAAFTALVPLFIFAERYSPAWSALAGAFAGAVVMGFLCRWLTAYHFAAVFIAIGIGLWWFMLAMTAISFLLATKSRLAFIATGFIWSCSELGRSVGFLAFPYGTLPYAFVESRAA